MKKKVIIPGLFLAVLSTPAFEKAVEAAEIDTPAAQEVPASVEDYIDHAKSFLRIYSNPAGESKILPILTKENEGKKDSKNDGKNNAKNDGKSKNDAKKDAPPQQKAGVEKTANDNGSKAPANKDKDGQKATVNNNRGNQAKPDNKASGGNASTGQSQTAPKPVTKYVNVDSGSNLNVRKEPSTNAAVVDKLPRGTAVSVISENNGWVKVKANGIEGYVRREYLSEQKIAPVTPAKPKNPEPKPNPKPVTKYVNVNPDSSLLLRDKPSKDAAVISRLSRGTKVTVYSESNGWAKVKANGKDGYVSAQYLSSSQPSAQTKPTTKYVNVDPGSYLNMRTGPSTSHSVVSKLARGTKVTVQSEQNGWAKVSANGKTGYVNAKYLSSTQVKNTATKVTNNATKQPAEKKPAPKTGVLSGNVKTVYKTYGISLDRLTNIQMKVKPQKLAGGKWVGASWGDVRYYLNPANFVNNPADSLQFLKLSAPANLNAAEVNAKILKGKGILEGKAQAFIDAAKKYGVNEMYLIAHALLETGNGKSALAQGVKVNGKTVYNMYGIGAKDGSSGSNGAQRAYKEGWFSPEAAIIGGAKFIAEKYIHAGQDTLYKMRWNPAGAAANGVATHQYATDIAWAVKQSRIIYQWTKLINNYNFTLEIPRYQ